MTVFTCFNHGTGYNRVKGEEKQELVHVLSQMMRGAEAKIENGVLLDNHPTYLITEGPGSPPTDEVHMPSTHNPFLNTKKGTVGNLGMSPLEESLARSGLTPLSKFRREFRGETAKYSSGWANATGGGWTDNMAQIAFKIQALKFDHNIDIKTVNMIGWSRGAVTCIRAANVLWELFGDEIEVNIFAIDPVAGMDAGIKKKDTQILPRSVKNFIAILASHELRSTFKPQDLTRIRPDDSSRTKVLFLPMAGRHATQVVPEAGYEEAYGISINMAYSCLKEWGTDFDETPNPRISNARDMCNSYAAMRRKLDSGSYKKTQNKSIKDRAIGLGFRRRGHAKTKNMDKYVVGGKNGYWVNEHHRRCFQDAYPTLYTIIFARRNTREEWVPFNGVITGNELLQSLLENNFISMVNNQVRFANKGAGYFESTYLHAFWPQSIPVA